MIYVEKTTIKTHKHTHLYFCLFVYRIYILFMYTLSSIVVVIFVVFLWIFRRFSLVAFAGCTAHVHCFHETATALATGHGTTEFSRLSPLSVNRTHSLSLSLASPTCSRFSAASRALLMIARATPTKYLTTFLYTHTYRERDTIYDRIHRIFSWKTHMTNDSIANGKANSWLRVAGVWQAGRGMLWAKIFFAFHWEIFFSDFLFFFVLKKSIKILLLVISRKNNNKKQLASLGELVVCSAQMRHIWQQHLHIVH